jgi:molybdopterin converting factor small subunit
MNQPTITIELFGMPRARAAVKEVAVSASNAKEALTQLITKCPQLAEIFTADGSLCANYLLSLDGQRFISDLSHPLRPGDRLLLLAADAGG